VKYEKRLGENVSFWYISELGVHIFMKLWYLTLFLVFWCVARSFGECPWSLGDFVLDCMELQVLKCWHSFIWDEYYFMIYVCLGMDL